PRRVRKGLSEYATLSRLQSASTLSLPVPETPSETPKRSRLSHLFSSSQGNDKGSEKVEELYRCLTSFSVYGLPRLPDEVRGHWEIGEGPEGRIQLPNSWKDVVHRHE
ncbi:hypothetical protein chiPu_0026973, partial [Chiloscyllium punctatum]|nr:hypothetical protein [Chiloscyllium punctatum]